MGRLRLLTNVHVSVTAPSSSWVLRGQQAALGCRPSLRLLPMGSYPKPRIKKIKEQADEWWGFY